MTNTRPSKLKRFAVNFVRITVAIGILGWLLYELQRKDPDALSRFVQRPKHVGFLLAGLGTLLLANCLAFVRWFLLVRALEIRFALGEAFKLGFMAYALNFVGPGAIGGDVYKAYSIARLQKSRRMEAAATIFLDRAVGLYSMLVIASVAILLADLSHLDRLGQLMRTLPWVTLAATGVILVLMLPSRFSQPVVQRLTRIPLLGGAILRAAIALDLYRKRQIWLVVIMCISVIAHILVALTVHFADLAIHPTTPTMGQHLVISPIATVATASPLPGGLGTYELAMQYLYQNVPTVTLEAGQGLAVAFCYRLLSISVAIIGAAYYFVNRQQVSNMAVELEAEHQEPVAS